MSSASLETDEETEARVDVTSLFQEAASCLSLVNHDTMIFDADKFSLLDSMGALEIMDQKMDCCEIPESEVSPFRRRSKKIAAEDDVEDVRDERRVFPRPLPTGLQDVVDPLPWNELTLENVAYICLECLIRLESLLSGASVVESTYTCLYAHAPVLRDMKNNLEGNAQAIIGTSIDNTSPLSLELQQNLFVNQSGAEEINGCDLPTLPQRILYAAILLLLDLTDAIRNISLSADIFEEEDFTISTYGVKVFERRRSKDSGIATTLALDELAKVLGENSDKRLIEVGTIIRNTLEFQFELLSVCDEMAKLNDNLPTIRKTVEHSQKMATNAASKLKNLISGSKSLQEMKSIETKALLKRSFDSFVTRPLVGNAPVRNVVFLGSCEAIESLMKTTKEFDWALCDVILQGNTLGRIRRMLAKISLADVNIVVRSLLILNLFIGDALLGQYPFSDLISRHIRQLSGAPEAMFKNEVSVAFLNRLAKPMYEVLKVMLLNRNRQRAYLEAVIFADWDVLSHEAGIADMAVQQDPLFGPNFLPYFSVYTLHLTVEFMEHFVALGIELNLHQGAFELAIVYWYRDFLLSALITQLETLRRSKALAKQKEESIMATATAKRGKKKGGKNSKKQQQVSGKQKQDQEDIEDDIEFLSVSLKRGLCRGLLRFFAAINQAGLLADNSFEFTTKRRVFEMRFKSFETIPQPPLLAYDDFVSGFDFSRVAPLDLISVTTESFQTVKTAFIDPLLPKLKLVSPTYAVVTESEVSALSKVAFGNSIYLQKLKQKVNSHTLEDTAINGKPEIDLSTHKHFCTIKIN